MSKPESRTSITPSCPASQAILRLFAMIKAVAEKDDGRPGPEIVSVLTEWFSTVGIDTEMSVEAAGPALFSGRHAAHTIAIYVTGVDEGDALAGLPYDDYESAWDCARVNDGHNIYAVTATLEESSIQMVDKLDDEDLWGRASEVTS